MKNIILPDMTLIDFKYMYPVFDVIKNGIALTDENSKILYVNPFYTEVTGYLREEVIGKNPGILRSGYHDEDFYKQMWANINNYGFWEGEIWNRNKAGKVYPTLLTITKIVNRSDNMINYLAVFSDISFLMKEDKVKINLAFYDFLTKLPNRLLLEDYFKRMVSKYKREAFDNLNQDKTNDKIILVFFDLNKFKQINDQHGHVVGDKMLKEVACRLQSLVRGSDIIARFGGDEFVAILTGIKSKHDLQKFCDRLDSMFANPFNIDDLVIDSSCSIGVSCYPDDSESFLELVNKADKAMYAAKEKWAKKHSS